MCVVHKLRPPSLSGRVRRLTSRPACPSPHASLLIIGPRKWWKARRVSLVTAKNDTRFYRRRWLSDWRAGRLIWGDAQNSVTDVGANRSQQCRFATCNVHWRPPWWLLYNLRWKRRGIRHERKKQAALFRSLGRLFWVQALMIMVGGENVTSNIQWQFPEELRKGLNLKSFFLFFPILFCSKNNSAKVYWFCKKKQLDLLKHI